MRTASVICRPMVRIGLSAVIGSCGMSATVRPRSASMTLRLPVTSWPPMRASPEMTARSSGSRRRMAIAVVDLPEPDSPMIVTVSPWSMWKLTPSTARTTLRRRSSARPAGP